MGGTATYGFVLYYDLSSAIVAKKYMDGQNLKGNNIRVRILCYQIQLYILRCICTTVWRVNLLSIYSNTCKSNWQFFDLCTCTCMYILC